MNFVFLISLFFLHPIGANGHACFRQVEARQSLPNDVNRLLWEVSQWVESKGSPSVERLVRTSSEVSGSLSRAARASRFGAIGQRLRAVLLLDPAPRPVDHLRQAQSSVSELEASDRALLEGWLVRLQTLSSRIQEERLQRFADPDRHAVYGLAQSEALLVALANTIRDRLAIDSSHVDIVSNLRDAIRAQAVKSRYAEFCMAQSFCTNDVVFAFHPLQDLRSNPDGMTSTMHRGAARLRGVTELFDLEVQADSVPGSLRPGPTLISASPSDVARANPGLSQNGLGIGTEVAITVDRSDVRHQLLAGVVSGFFVDGTIFIYGNNNLSYRVRPERIRRVYGGHLQFLEYLSEKTRESAPHSLPDWLSPESREILHYQRRIGVSVENGRPTGWIYAHRPDSYMETLLSWRKPSFLQRRFDQTSGVSSVWRPTAPFSHDWPRDH